MLEFVWPAAHLWEMLPHQEHGTPEPQQWWLFLSPHSGSKTQALGLDAWNLQRIWLLFTTAWDPH